MKQPISKSLFSKKIVLLILYVLALSLGLSLTAFTQKAEALSGSEFNAGHIISDSTFYNSNDMTAQQIQSFLNVKVPVCDTNGEKMYNSTQTRAQWAAANGRPLPPYTCLKNYSQNVPTITNGGSDLCTSSVSGGTKSAAQIIYDVAKACGVNPKVLIVLLQKEQSLVTDDWPWPIQYRSATGYGCPDTAPCDSEYYGFFNQVYQAAQAYRRYRANPTNYNYRAGRNNTILWHPNTACGTSTVYIENQATAGLYIYTPYRPNQAALNNLYGSGDSCSSYGNRNFWRMFNDWFGSTIKNYAADVLGVDVYTDAARTNKLTSIPAQRSGQVLYFRVTARNTGYLDWTQSLTRIGTASPFNRSSKFIDNSWLTSGRPAQLIESLVAPSEVGTFEFSMTMPNQDGYYAEHFHALVEGKEWMYGGDFSFGITVRNPYNGQTISVSTYRGSSYSQPISSHSMIFGQQIYVRVLVKNTGSTTWDPSVVRIGTSNPNNRLSSFTDGSWLSPGRPAQLKESSVATGQTGTFEFSMTAPGTAGSYDEDFQLLAEGVSWMPGALFSKNIGVSENPPDRLISNQRLYSSQLVQSSNSLYRLIVQGDGNLVLYSPNRAIWSTQTHNNGAGSLIMQGDGNLVLYDSQGTPLWNTRTNGHKNLKLILQGDGNLVLYDGSGRALWSSRTNGKI